MASTPPKQLFREFTISPEARAKINPETRTVELAFSSETPVERWGEEEILSHERGNFDLSRLTNGAPLLLNHDSRQQIGVIETASVDADKMGRATVRFSRSKAAEEIFQDVCDGIRKKVSFGYERTGLIKSEGKKGEVPRAYYSWFPYEISIVSIPADDTVGVGREKETEATTPPPVDLNQLTEEQKNTLRAKLMSEKAPEPIVIDEPKVRADERNKAREATIKELRERNTEITKLADEFVKDHGMKKRGALGETLRKLANEFVTRDGDKASEAVINEFKFRSLEEIAKVQPEPYLMSEQVGEREMKRYSLLRAIQTAIEDCEKTGSRAGRPSGFEREVHDDMVKRAKEQFGGLGYEAGGFQVPCDAPITARAAGRRMVRDGLTVGIFGSGGALVPTEMRLPVIEALRNRTVLDNLGIRFLGGLQGNVVIPRQTGVSAPSAVAEIAQLAASNPQFDQIALTPRRCGNTVPYSKQLLLQSSPDVEALIRDDNFAQIAIKIDSMGLNGSGANSEPLGIMQQPGINSIVFGAAATYAKIVSMETSIRKQNIYDPVSFVSTSNARGVLRVAPETLTGSTVVSGSTNAIWKTGDNGETIIGRAAYDSQQIPNDQMLCVVGQHVIWGMWGGLDVVVDYISLADKGQVRLTINTWNDFAVRHPQAICVSVDSAAQ